MSINTIRLRWMLGFLAIFLPWIVAAVVGYIPPSISATWYTNACTPFMIILGASAIILICYKGYELIDDILLSLSGVFALLICLFPCSISNGQATTGVFNTPMGISNTIHCVAAFIFFALLSYNSLFLFTKGDAIMTKKKKIRNIIYRVCGVGMLASFLLLLLPDFYIKVWLVETFALTFFGISFLTKADIFPFLFCDTPYKD